MVSHSMMMNPTVLFVLHLPPPVHGAAMVGKYIHDSELIGSAFDCHFVNLATAADLEDIGKLGVKKLFSFLKLLWEIRRAVRARRPALVYITPNAKGGAFYKDFIVVEMLKSMGCQVVAHYHNKGVVTRQNCWLDDRLYRRFFKGLKVILLADVLYHDVEKYVRREDVQVCPNGIPDVEPRPAEVCPESAIKAVPRLLFLSNLIESKGVLVLMDALKLVKERGGEVVCDFVGGETAEMDGERFLEEARQRRLQDVVVYHGKKYGAEKEEYWERADAFVFPTYYPNECFPLVILEAMQHALPCISTCEGAIPDIIEEGKTGIVVGRKSPEELADAISRLTGDATLRRTMGKAAREEYEKKYGLEAFERKMCSILHQLTES